MATQLISIRKHTFSDRHVDAVDARELHKYLGVGKRFTTWIQDRIKQYGFEAGADYVVCSRLPELGSGNRGSAKDYFIALDMAKELAMVERNDKGRQARRYFIECEKKYQERYALPSLSQSLAAGIAGPDSRLLAVIDTYKQIIKRQGKSAHVDALVKNYLGVRSLKEISSTDADRAIVMLQQLIAVESDSDWKSDHLVHIPFSMLFQICNQAAYAHRLLGQLDGLSAAMGDTLGEVEGYLGHPITTVTAQNH